MNISFDQFESFIDATILKRGWDYFRQGCVQELEELDEGVWSALVEGTDIYEVKIKFESNQIIDSTCTCPYDMGPVCKHGTAVLYAIQKQINGSQSEELSIQKMKPKRTVSRKTVVDKVEEALQNISAEKLKEFVRECALDDGHFRNRLFTVNMGDLETGSKETYKELILDSLRAAKDRDGFIDYWHATHAVNGAHRLLEKAEQLLNKNSPEKAIPIGQACIETLVPALQNSDDSDGTIGGAIGHSFDLLERVASQLQKQSNKEMLFQYCLSEAKHRRYEGWSDWQWYWMHIAGLLIEEDKQQELFFKHCDQLLKAGTDGFGRYDEERAAGIKLEVFQRRGKQKEEDQFVQDHLHFPSIRRLAIKKAFESKNYAKAKTLAQEGIKKDSTLPGLVKNWIVVLLQVAEKEKDRESIYKYARQLFLEQGEFEYYEKLKAICSPEQWKQEVKTLMSETKRGKGWLSLVHPEICIREKEWESFLEWVKENVSMHTLEHYHRHLADHFPEPLLSLYEQCCRESLANAAGRSRYQEVCRVLRRMKKMGGDKTVLGLIKEFGETYKNRRALLEELGRV